MSRNSRGASPTFVNVKTVVRILALLGKVPSWAVVESSWIDARLGVPSFLTLFDPQDEKPIMNKADMVNKKRFLTDIITRR
jgi:hypothetical protein